MCWEGTQDISSGPYPSQSTRYWSPLPRRRERMEVGGTPINKPGRRRRRGSRNQRALWSWLDFRDMECWIDPHGPGQLEPYCRRVDDPLDFEWANESGCQLLRLHSKWKVLGRQPHLLAHLVGGGFGTTPVGRLGVPVGRAMESCSGQCPRPAAAADEGLDRRRGHLPLQDREQWRLETIGALERGQSSGRAGQGVVGVFHP